MTIKKELENQIKIREDMNKKWGGAVYSDQEILNIKQKLKQLSNKESK
jgi:hypothetical protein